MRTLVDQCLRRRLLILASLAIATMRFVGAPVDAHAQAQTGTIVGRVTDARRATRSRERVFRSKARASAPSPARTAGIASSACRAGTRSILVAPHRLFVESAGGHRRGRRDGHARRRAGAERGRARPGRRHRHRRRDRSGGRSAMPCRRSMRRREMAKGRGARHQRVCSRRARRASTFSRQRPSRRRPDDSDPRAEQHRSRRTVR